jgi:hypothetical protein
MSERILHDNPKRQLDSVLLPFGHIAQAPDGEAM